MLGLLIVICQNDFLCAFFCKFSCFSYVSIVSMSGIKPVYSIYIHTWTSNCLLQDLYQFWLSVDYWHNYYIILHAFASVVSQTWVVKNIHILVVLVSYSGSNEKLLFKMDIWAWSASSFNGEICHITITTFVKTSHSLVNYCLMKWEQPIWPLKCEP